MYLLVAKTFFANSAMYFFPQKVPKTLRRMPRLLPAPYRWKRAPNRGFASKPAPFLALLVRRPPTAPPSSRNPCCRVSPLLAVPRKFRTGVFSAFRVQRRKSGRGSARPERACEKARSFVSVQRGAVAAPVKTVCGWFWVPFATKRYQYIFSAKGSRKHSTLS